ncbi:unnamed protein product [Prorocentrum cordatum]|uniref:Uncharacterized protein n=1 Tax=Prorocentrum cordatum TaxID=2364126 RepID=A0ABN9QYG5_9DINO|nr:unnamed protein product [Polarella glacialis]
MPGFSDADVEEFSSYEPGVSVHIGKMNRVKCHARTARHGEPEALYLLPVQSSLVLVRPDDQKPFWALPVVAESLLHVRLLASTDKMGPLEQIPSPGSNGDELQRILKLEVSSPRSPFLRSFGLDGVGKDRIGCSLVAAPPPGGQMDPMTMSVPVAPGAAPGESHRGRCLVPMLPLARTVSWSSIFQMSAGGGLHARFSYRRSTTSRNARQMAWKHS